MFWLIAIAVLVGLCFAAYWYSTRENSYEMYKRYRMAIKFDKGDVQYWYDRWIEEGGMKHRRYSERRWDKWDNF